MPKIKMSPEMAKQARADLGALRGTTGFSMVYQDGYFANSLVTKYGMSTSELEIASGYRKAVKAKAEAPKRAAALAKENRSLKAQIAAMEQRLAALEQKA